MKKALALMLALTMLFALAACAPKQDKQSDETKTSEQEEPETSAGPEVLQDVRVRKALSFAIDRDYINETVFNNSRIPAYALVPAGVADAQPESDFRTVGGNLMGSDVDENIKEAQALLAQAGFPNGEGFPKLEYVYDKGTSNQAIAEAIQFMWKQNLGIDVELVNLEWNVFQPYRKANSCQIARQGWLGDYPDPSTFFDLFLSDAGANDAHYNNPEYDTLVREAKAMCDDPAARMEMYHQAEDIIMADMPFAPIVFYADDVLRQTDFEGFGVTSTGNKMFWEANKPKVSVCVGSQPETLDPTMNQSADGNIYITHLFEGLYRVNVDGTFSLGQAKDAKIDGKKVTVTLRDDIVWSDGVAVTAHDFEFSWKRFLNSEIAAPPYQYLGAAFFANGQQVMEGSVEASELSVTAVDDRTLEFELFENIPYLENLLAFSGWMPLREDIVAENPNGWATSAQTLVTNGRYVMDAIANEQLVMKKSDTYWDADSTKVDAITFKLMSDDKEILAAFKNKELDLADTFPMEERAAVEATMEYERYGQIGLYFIQFNNIAVAAE